MSKNTTSKHTKITPFDLYNGITDADLKPGPKTVLLVLARFINWKRDDFIVWPSQETIGEKAKLDRHTVGKHLLALCNAEYIEPILAKGKQGMHYKYEIMVGTFCTNGRKPATPMAEDLPHPGRKPAMKESKGKELDVEGLEVFQTQSVRYAHSCDGKTSTEDRDMEERRLLENFSTYRCRADKNTRLRFYMECGRAFTDADHFHKPKDPSKPLSWNQLGSLRIWFNRLPESGCEVMVFAMRHWSGHQLRGGLIDALAKKHNVTPTISALEKWESEPLLREYLAHRHEQMLKQVEQHAPPIDDDYYLRDDTTVEFQSISHGVAA